MADGIVTIDIDMPLDKFKSDMQLAEDLLKDLGSGAGDKMDTDFKKSSNEVVAEAKDVKKDVDNELKKPTATITPKVDDSEAQKGTQKVITSLRKLPKEQKVKLDADAKRSGIDNFTDLLKRVPKKTQTEILAHVQKNDVINYEHLLNKLPAKVITEARLNDNASVGLKKLKHEAEETKTGFEKLKATVAGSFLGTLGANAIGAITSSWHEAVEAGAEYNKEQDTMRTVWKSLTTEAPQDGKELVNYINSLSQHSIYAADTINEMAQSFYHVHSNVDETKKWTDSFVALGSTMHMTNDKLSEASEMFAKIVAGGKASAEDLDVMINRFPMFGEAIQEATGKSMKQLREMSASGKLTAEEFTKALDFLGDKYKGGTEEAMNSFMGMSMYIKSHVSQLSGDVQKGFFEMAKGSLTHIRELVSDKHIQAFAKEISKALAGVAAAFNSALTFVINNSKAISLVGDVIKQTFGAIGNTLSMFATSFKANVIGVLNNKEANENIERLKKGFDAVFQAIKPVEQAIGGFLGVIAGTVIRTATTLIKGLAEGFGFVGDEGNKAKKKLDFSGIFKVISSMSQTINAVSDALAPVVSLLSQIAGVIAKEAFKTFVDIAESIGKSVGNIAQKLVQLLPELDGTEKGMSFITKHEKGLKAVGVAIATIGTAIMAMKGASLVLKGISSAIALVNAAMAINPIVLVVGAVVTLGVAIYEAYKHFKPFRDVVDIVWGALKSFGSGVAKVGKQIYHGIVDGISDVISWIKKNWKGLGLLLVNPIAGAIKLLYDNNKGFKKWADSVIDTIKNAWKSATKALVKVWESIVDGIVKVWKPLSKALSVTWDALKKVAEITFKAIGAVILAPIVLVSATIVAVWKAVHKPLEAAWKAISKTASSVWNGIKDTVIDVSLAIYKPVKKAWDKVVKVVTDLWNGLKKTASKIWNGIKDAVVDATEAVYKPVHKAFTKVGNWIGDKWDNIKKITSDKWNNIKDTIGDMTDKAHSVAKRNTEALKSSVSEKWDAVKSVTGKAWGSVSDYVGEHSANAKNKASKNFNALKDTMSSILDSISQTWKRIWGGISDYFSDIWNDIKKNAKNGLNGVIDFLNGGVDGINNVVSFFGGSKKTVPRLPRLAKGGRMSKSTLALVNDEESPTYREAIFRRDGSIEVPKERNVLTHLEAGDAVMPAKQTAMLLGLPQYKGGFGDWLGKAASFVGNATGDIGEWLADKIDQLEDALKNPLELLMSLFKKEKNTASAIWHDIGEGAGKYIPESAVDWFKNKLSEFKKKFDESGGSNPPGEGVERWRSVIKHAAGMLHTDLKDWQINNMLKQIQTESGGNPNIVQTVWDVNMANGNPAQGLLQFIPETFKSWAVPGHTDIHNGLDQILAAIRRLNAMDTWNYIGHGHGWATGGHVYDKQIAWIAEDGDEFVINNRKPNADNLIANAIKQRAEINPNSFSAKIAHIIDGARMSGVNGYGVTPQVTPTPHTINGSQPNNASVKVEGDTVISVQLDSDTIARATYPKQKLMQAQEITIVGNGGAIPVV